MTMSLKFWIGFCGEVILISIFWPFVILAGISLTGLIDLPISMYIFVPTAIVFGLSWILFRFKKMKEGKYYLNEL